jgi:hypothetical protein
MSGAIDDPEYRLALKRGDLKGCYRLALNRYEDRDLAYRLAHERWRRALLASTRLQPSDKVVVLVMLEAVNRQKFLDRLLFHSWLSVPAIATFAGFTGRNIRKCRARLKAVGVVKIEGKGGQRGGDEDNADVFFLWGWLEAAEREMEKAAEEAGTTVPTSGEEAGTTVPTSQKPELQGQKPELQGREAGTAGSRSRNHGSSDSYDEPYEDTCDDTRRASRRGASPKEGKPPRKRKMTDVAIGSAFSEWVCLWQGTGHAPSSEDREMALSAYRRLIESGFEPDDLLAALTRDFATADRRFGPWHWLNQFSNRAAANAAAADPSEPEIIPPTRREP